MGPITDDLDIHYIPYYYYVPHVLKADVDKTFATIIE